MRRAATVLLTAALTSGALVASAPAATAAGDIVPRDLTITVTGVGPDDQPCTIDADLYVPRGVSAKRPGPALLTTNGFGGTKKDQADYAQSFGEHGYVTLAYTGLGFVDGDNCPITLDDREHDGVAASQLIRFLGGDPSITAIDDVSKQPVRVDQVIREDTRTRTPYDPQVGMVGGSYGGQIQFAAAAVEKAAGTNRLDAIVPQITWNDLSYSLAPENSSIPKGTARSGSVSSTRTGLFKYQWAGLFTTLGVANGVEDLPRLTDEDRARAYMKAAAGAQTCANFELEVCRALGEVATLGHPLTPSIDYLRSNSVSSYIGDVRVPTLLGQGQADTLFNLQESVATYTRLKAQGTPVSLQWQSWGHSDSSPVPGELDERHLERTVQGRSILAWFDHYVRDRGRAPVQNFSYFRDWVYAATGDAKKAYATAPSYPVGTERVWHLSSGQTQPAGGAVIGAPATLTAGGGSLITDGRKVVAGTSVYGSPSPIGPNYSETAYLEQTRPVQDPPTQAISFATPTLWQPIDVVGSPRVTVRLTSPTASAAEGPTGAGPVGMRLAVYAKLYDVGPDGKPVELPHRLISPVRVTDVDQPITIELPAIVHRFEKGHRLALVIAGGDMAYRGSDGRHPVTLTTDPAKPQKLVVPVVPG
ncbi:MAG: peptidase [Blastococcus sp.]|nr:peptidase [Blastococcus sp.]